MQTWSRAKQMRGPRKRVEVRGMVDKESKDRIFERKEFLQKIQEVQDKCEREVRERKYAD